MTKSEALKLLADYEEEPDGFRTCDNLCRVLIALPGQPGGIFTVEQVREMVYAKLDD